MMDDEMTSWTCNQSHYISHSVIFDIHHLFYFFVLCDDLYELYLTFVAVVPFEKETLAGKAKQSGSIHFCQCILQVES